MKHMQFTIGSDPELMIQNVKTGKIVSALPLLPDKYNPLKLKNGVEAYKDNILAEVKFPPVNTKADFIGIFKSAFAQLKETLGKDFAPIPLASHIYDASELKDPQAWEIGCTANYNAYTESQNETISFENGLRTGSCHIHVGNEKLRDFHMRHKAIRLLDIFVGCASVVFDRDIEASKARRKYYGACGEFRPTDYGLEYRVLSPFVLRSPELIGLVYDLVDYTMTIIENGNQDKILALVNAKDVHEAINNCNVSLARKILEQAKFSSSLFKRVEAKYDTSDFNKNWNI